MILFKKEKEVIDLISKHMNTVEACLENTNTALQAYLDNNIADAKTLARETDNIETKADMIRHEIRDKLYYGAYMPLLKEDIYKLVESIDKVCNSGEKCCDFFLNQRPEIPEELKADFAEIVKVGLGIGKPLKQSLMCYLEGVCPIEASRQYSKEVGLMESKIDDLEWALAKKVFISDLDFAHKIHLRQCLDRIVEISDRAENAADQLELVTLKSMI